VQEVAVGNREFVQAKEALWEQLKAFEPRVDRGVPEVNHFLRVFARSFSSSLDELSPE